MGFFPSFKILFLFCIFVSGESIAVSWKLSWCHTVMQYSIFVTQKKGLLLFFWPIMAFPVYSNNPDTRVTFWVTHKNNRNVRQIITLARSGLFMEYCCLVLGVCVSEGFRRGMLFQTDFHQDKNVKGSLKPLLVLGLVCYSVETRLKWG